MAVLVPHQCTVLGVSRAFVTVTMTQSPWSTTMAGPGDVPLAPMRRRGAARRPTTLWYEIVSAKRFWLPWPGHKHGETSNVVHWRVTAPGRQSAGYASGELDGPACGERTRVDTGVFLASGRVPAAE